MILLWLLLSTEKSIHAYLMGALVLDVIMKVFFFSLDHYKENYSLLQRAAEYTNDNFPTHLVKVNCTIY
jgi:hypothetical protein